MIYQGNASTVTNPRNDIDPKLKLESKWHLEVANYIFSYHSGSWLQQRQREFKELRAYARGDQDRNQYKAIYMGQDNNTQQGAPSEYGPDERTDEFYSMVNHRMGFANIDFERIFSPAPNILTTLRGIMEGQKHGVRVYAVDENALNDRKAIEYRMKVQLDYKDLFETFAVVLGDNNETPTPSSMEELKMYGVLGGFKLPYEVGIQECLDYTFRHESADDDLKERVLNDFATIGMSAAIDYVDEYAQREKFRYADPDNLIIQYNDDTRRFKDIQFWGYQRYMTILDIRIKTGWNEDEIRKLAETFNNKPLLGNRNIDMDSSNVYLEDGSCNYNDIRVPVLDYEYLTVDSKYYTKITGKEETLTVEEYYKNKGYKAPKMKNKENRKTTKDDIHKWYRGTWVIDTDKVFDYGPKFDQPWDVKLREPKCSLHFYCLPGPPIIKQILPMLNDCEMLYLRYQNDLATAPPANGVSVEMGSLNNIKIGTKKLHPFDTMKIRFQSGISFWNFHQSVVPGGQNSFNNIKPFDDVPGGIGLAVKDFVSGITNAYQQIAALTGIDRVTMNSFTPSSEQPASLVKLAMSSTKDTLKPLYHSWVKIEESLAGNIIIQCQQLISSSKKSGYDGIISTAKLEAIRIAGSTPPAEYGMETVAMPNEDEIAKIEGAAQAATAGGKNGIPALTFSEYLFIVDSLKTGVPIKHVMAYIAYKEMVADAKSQEMSTQAQKMDTEKGIAVNKAKSADLLAQQTAKDEAEAKRIILKGMVDIMVNAKKSEEDLKKMAFGMGFDVGQADFNAQQQQQMGGMEQGMEQPMGMQDEVIPQQEEQIPPPM